MTWLSRSVDSGPCTEDSLSAIRVGTARALYDYGRRGDTEARRFFVDDASEPCHAHRAKIATIMPPTDLPETAFALLDAESKAWIDRLGPESPDRETAIEALHALLLKAARFEVRRRSPAFPHLRGNDHDDLAHQSAHDALLAVLGKLGDFRGESRFTTWAYKFALLEAAVKVRRRAWQGRELPIEPKSWALIADDGSTPQQDVETGEILTALREAIERDLSPHQREVLLAITLRGVPIDVLSERLDTTRGALYKTVHDARRKLREALAARGLVVGKQTETVAS